MKITTKISAVAVTLGAILISGCSSVVVKPVSESGKNNSGNYDGRWMTTAVHTRRLQYGPGNWQFTCEDRSGDQIGIIEVVDGKARFSWDESGTEGTFVSNSGKFRFEIPTGVVAAASGTSDSSISNGDMTALIYGSLKSGKGKFTLGIAQFGNAGCTSKLQFQKL